MIEVKRALLSAYDKTGLIEFAKALNDLGIEIVSTGGTARDLQGAGLEVTPVEKLTGLPDLFEGRVKTLTPQIHGGLLMRRDNPEDRQQALDHGIAGIDLLCVNLYPFADTIASSGDDRAACIEMIDIGGPAMLRAAAKNHRHVVVVSEPERYTEIARILQEGQGSFPEEQAAILAAATFAQTAAYDAMIHQYLAGEGPAGRAWAAGGRLLQSLRYGENPSQGAACYVGGAGFWQAKRQLQGKELSYNNLGDIWAAWQCLAEFDETACVIIKHCTPCGVAMGAGPTEAFARARDCDSLSAFGGVVLLNRPGDEEVAGLMTEMFLEVVGAPAWSEKALGALARKKNLRVLQLPERMGPPRGVPRGAFRSHGEAILVQDSMQSYSGPAGWELVTDTGALSGREQPEHHPDFGDRLCCRPCHDPS